MFVLTYHTMLLQFLHSTFCGPTEVKWFVWHKNVFYVVHFEQNGVQFRERVLAIKNLTQKPEFTLNL